MIEEYEVYQCPSHRCKARVAVKTDEAPICSSPNHLGEKTMVKEDE